MPSGSIDPTVCVSAGTPKLALYYFDGRGRAELSRLLLALGGVAYEDHRLSDVRVLIASARGCSCSRFAPPPPPSPQDEIAALKPSLPSGQVPVLAIDGVFVPQVT